MTELDHPAPAPTRGSFLRLSASATWNLIFERQGRSPPGLAVFDVRDRKDYDSKRVDGALHLTESRFPEIFGQIPQSTAVVIYCDHGHSSQTFAAMFSDFGFREVYSVDGGFEALAADHAERQHSNNDSPAWSLLPEPEPHYLVGDIVFCREPLYNDAGIPDVAPEALLADGGARGVIVRFGHTEANPAQAVYVVRFENPEGDLGPPVGCLPDELTQEHQG